MCMLTILCTTKFYLCGGEVCACWLYLVPHGVFYLCERGGVCWLYSVPQGVIYLCGGEVRVGYTVYHKVCFTCVKERCVLAIPCATRCVFPV